MGGEKKGCYTKKGREETHPLAALKKDKGICPGVKFSFQGSSVMKFLDLKVGIGSIRLTDTLYISDGIEIHKLPWTCSSNSQWYWRKSSLITRSYLIRKYRPLGRHAGLRAWTRGKEARSFHPVAGAPGTADASGRQDGSPTAGEK